MLIRVPRDAVPVDNPPLSSFTARRLNSTTFVILEHDSFSEEPLIYAKLHPAASLLILTDTGCDSPNSTVKNARYTHLRDFLENCPLECNDGQPLNPGPTRRKYMIICTHCHYDHTLGIPQFLKNSDGSVLDSEIVASAAGHYFITHDLAHNGLFANLNIPWPEYHVTHWANSFERLHYQAGRIVLQDRSKRKIESATTSGASSTCHAVDEKLSSPIDLAITIIHTPGHTPDSLAWYDYTERWLYVGDTVYGEYSKETTEVFNQSDRQLSNSLIKITLITTVNTTINTTIFTDANSHQNNTEELDKPGSAIIWPPQGNIIEWIFSLQKLLQFVRAKNNPSQWAEQKQDTSKPQQAPSTNSPEAESEAKPEPAPEPAPAPAPAPAVYNKRVTLSSGHTTTSTDAEAFLLRALDLMHQVLKGDCPVIWRGVRHGEMFAVWRWSSARHSDGDGHRNRGGDGERMYFLAPVRLVDDAREFFSLL